MIYETNFLSVAVFGVIVALTLGLSFYLGRKSQSSDAYFAAGGSIHCSSTELRLLGIISRPLRFLGSVA